MLLYAIIIVVCICSFLSALAIFSACVVAGRNNNLAHYAHASDDPFTVLHAKRTTLDDARLNRLADSI